MKPPAFDYVAPGSVSEAVAELAKHGGEARPLAGGQSLVPMLNFRLAAPTMLVDLGRIADLSGVAIDDSHLRIGATTRTARLLSEDVRSANPVVSAATRLVAHPQIRNRGTVGGSIANADPAAELPAVALLTGASIHLAGPSGTRTVRASEFFEGMFTTACGWDEILVAVDIPKLPAGAGWGFREFARRPGDFALAGVGVMLTVEDGTIASVVVVVFGIGERPLRVSAAEEALTGAATSPQALTSTREAFEAAIEPDENPYASASYKRRVAGALFAKCIADAIETAGVAGAGRA